VARWREPRAAVEIPAWVFLPGFESEFVDWLDGLQARDPVLWEQALTAVISTPTYSDSRVYPGG
jgi:hypothetical protein